MVSGVETKMLLLHAHQTTPTVFFEKQPLLDNLLHKWWLLEKPFREKVQKKCGI